jgi:hypothetical protein
LVQKVISGGRIDREIGDLINLLSILESRLKSVEFVVTHSVSFPLPPPPKKKDHRYFYDKV